MKRNDFYCIVMPNEIPVAMPLSKWHVRLVVVSRMQDDILGNFLGLIASACIFRSEVDQGHAKILTLVYQRGCQKLHLIGQIRLNTVCSFHELKYHLPNGNQIWKD